MSVQDQEQREERLSRRMRELQREADRTVGAAIEEKQRQAELRADEVERRIERGDVKPRPLPGKRRDSVESTQSTPSTKSTGSTASTPSAEPAGNV